ncbi:MAG: HAMP domain-containing histidine kinase [Leptolyngbyaceae cyanobacterium SM2_5_2]|nr:HAMP domain-containing histidine kinase [Leptolyngbyaceae cyanobacterium SM2_5_2]
MNQPLANPDDDMQALQLACNRLQQQCQFQAAFLGTASHELRAPINQIISLHQLILEDLCESPTEEREFIAQANQTMITVLKNLDTLISVSKLDIGALQPKFQTMELVLILAMVQQLMEMKCINRHCRLSLIAEDDTLTVWTDLHWLQQALVTLIDAALAAGSTAIYLTAQPQDATTVRLELICDSHPDRWFVKSPPRTSTTAPSQLSLELPLSPSFAYQMAARMMPHLQGTIVQDRSLTPEQQRICITLPQVEQL